LVHPFALNVKTYVTVIGDAVLFVKVSLILLFPDPPIFELMPEIAFRIHAIVVPAVALVGE
jgi:hypothetical protein